MTRFEFLLGKVLTMLLSQTHLPTDFQGDVKSYSKLDSHSFQILPLAGKAVAHKALRKHSHPRQFTGAGFGDTGASAIPKFGFPLQLHPRLQRQPLTARQRLRMAGKPSKEQELLAKARVLPHFKGKLRFVYLHKIF